MTAACQPRPFEPSRRESAEMDIWRANVEELMSRSGIYIYTHVYIYIYVYIRIRVIMRMTTYNNKNTYELHIYNMYTYIL